MIGDDYLVEQSGSLITFDNLPVNIIIGEMVFEVIFSKNPLIKKFKCKNTVINDNLMRIELFNFEVEFSYKDRPQEILYTTNKIYYLDLIVAALGTKRILLNYMILSKSIRI